MSNCFLYQGIFRTNSLPDNKNIGLPQLRGHANNVISGLEYNNGRYLLEGKNIMGKGENAGYQHFFLFP